MLIHGATDNDLHPPRFGGTQRAFGLFRGMARRHDVRVLCMVPNRNRAPREATANRVTLLRRKAWYTSAAWRLERMHLAPLAAAADVHTLRSRALLAELPGRADVFAAEFGLAGLLGRCRAGLKVYLSQNVEADFFAATAPALALGPLWRARVRAREARAVRRSHVTVVVSDEDAARMIELHRANPARIEVIPNGYDETVVRPPSSEERARARAALGLAGEHAALFVGSDVAHNRDAVRLLVERLLPPLAREGVVLLVAGSVGRAVAHRREPWLRVLGEVDDLVPILHAADSGVNPVARGGGSNVKVPTCLAAGLAMITTRFGLRGYPSLEPWVTVADPDDFPDVLRTRPAGWRARGLALPGPVADHAWGRLGETLAVRLERRIAAHAPHADTRGRASA
jgi:glycosyltransferase involved in cell wall biosynthesis